jgi:hypothetical protein
MRFLCGAPARFSSVFRLRFCRQFQPCFRIFSSRDSERCSSSLNFRRLPEQSRGTSCRRRGRLFRKPMSSAFSRLRFCGKAQRDQPFLMGFLIVAWLRRGQDRDGFLAFQNQHSQSCGGEAEILRRIAFELGYADGFQFKKPQKSRAIRSPKPSRRAWVDTSGRPSCRDTGVVGLRSASGRSRGRVAVPIRGTSRRPKTRQVAIWKAGPWLAPNAPANSILVHPEPIGWHSEVKTRVRFFAVSRPRP